MLRFTIDADWLWFGARLGEPCTTSGRAHPRKHYHDITLETSPMSSTHAHPPSACEAKISKASFGPTITLTTSVTPRQFRRLPSWLLGEACGMHGWDTQPIPMAGSLTQIFKVVKSGRSRLTLTRSRLAHLTRSITSAMGPSTFSIPRVTPSANVCTCADHSVARNVCVHGGRRVPSRWCPPADAVSALALRLCEPSSVHS